MAKTGAREVTKTFSLVVLFILVPEFLFGNGIPRNSVSFSPSARNGVSRSAFPNGVWERDEKPAAPKPKGKFTLSKETTYITGPLDANGYIDYVAGINERLKEGVTPESNANVLLWKAMGPRPERVPMPPEFFQWMGIESPPDKGQYFVSLWDHLKENRKREVSLEEFNDLETACLQKPWQPKDYPEVAAWLKANEKPLALVLEASKRSRYYSPLVPYKKDGVSLGLMNSIESGVQKNRQFAMALRTRAMLRLGEASCDDAWQDLLACHRLGRLVGRGGTMSEELVGIALDQVASAADLIFLNHAKPDAQRLAKCLRDLQQLPPLPGLAQKIDLGERF